jgi:hypothetical protein
MRTGFTHHSKSVALIKQGGLIVGIDGWVNLEPYIQEQLMLAMA